MGSNLFERRPELNICREDIEKSIELLINCFENGGKLLICGNGGSCADCEHIAGELLKGFMSKRRMPENIAKKFENALGGRAEKYINTLQMGLPVIPLPAITGVGTAFANDCDPELAFAQEVFAFAKPGDILLGISTSGNSKNVVAAAETAKAIGVKVISLTGEGGGRLSGLADVAIKAPASETYLIQELHLPIYHHICAEIERKLFI